MVVRVTSSNVCYASSVIHPLIVAIPSRISSSFSNTYDDICCVEVENSFGFHCLDHLKVLRRFSTIKSNAVGMYILHPIFLKLLLPKLLHFITHLFKSVLAKCTFSDDTKLLKIIPNSKSDSKFTPIANLPLLSTVLEISCKFLFKRQSCFLQGRSSLAFFLGIVKELKLQLNGNKALFVILIGQSKACDTIDHKVWISKLYSQFYFS